MGRVTDTGKIVTDGDEQLVFAGWLVDGTGGPIRSGAWIRVRGRDIVSVATGPPGPMPSEKQLDLGGFTLLPGLVDSHVHLTMSGTDDAKVRKAQLQADYLRAEAVIAGHLRRHFGCGIVMVRDGGDSAGHVLRFKSGQNRTLPPVGIRSAGRAWRHSGRYGRLIGRPPAPDQTLAQAVAADNPAPDHVKVVNSGLNSLTCFGKQTSPQFSLEELRAAVKAARARGQGIMVHANGQAPVAMAIAAGCRSVEHGFFMGADNLARMADAGVVWVPTAVTMKAYAATLAPDSVEAQMARRNFNHQCDQLRQARQLGVRVALGTDAGSLGVHHGAALKHEMAVFMESGWSLEEAVQSGSSRASSLVGNGYTGVVAPGHPATFIAVEGRPRDLPGSLDRVAWVWAKGVRYPADALNRSHP